MNIFQVKPFKKRVCGKKEISKYQIINKFLSKLNIEVGKCKDFVNVNEFLSKYKCSYVNRGQQGYGRGCGKKIGHS